MLSRGRKFIASSAAAAPIVAASVAIAGAAPGDPGSGVERSVAGPKTTAVVTVSGDILRTLSVFRTRTPTPIPADLVPRIASPDKYGRNPALARQIETVTGTGYVIPGDGYVCIVVPDPVDGYGSTCDTVGNIKKRGLYIGLKEGAIPVGKHAQTVVVPDGATAKVPGMPGDAARAAGTAGVVSELVDIGDDITVGVS